MTTLTHGTENNDENIIVEMVYDKGGRLTARRNPAGELTTYAYDDLDRRVGLTNPLNHTWETTYTDLPGAGQRTTLTDPNGHDTLRTTDWLGRVRSIAYGDPATTPDVVFGYDGAGNRTRMTEYGGAGFTNPVRETQFAHDAAGRMTQVGFDADGMGGADVTVSYAYDAGGLRTAMSLSTGETLGYRYDVQGRLVGMTDFDGAETRFSYDRLGRQVATFRPNGLRTVYQYDRASRLKRLAHEHGGRALAEFRYNLDGQGNRVRATETLAHPVGGGDTLITHADPLVVYSGSWSDTGTDHTSQSGEAALSIVFFGKDNVTLTMGEGSNHSRYDVYVDRRLWRTLDGYAPTSGTRHIHIPLDGTGPHLLEIRNRREHGKTCRENTPEYDASIHTVRVVFLTVEGTYTHRQVDYAYDALSRLVSAVDAADSYGYTYDVAGNRLSATHNSATTGYDYNAANQLTGDDVRTYTYDDNGNLISVTDGSLTTTYTWDRANRMMMQADGTDSYHYAYDGLGNRVQQTVNSVMTDYLLDLQPGLTKVIVQMVGGNTQHIVHSPRGVHAQWDGTTWQHLMQDGLGSVRGVVTQAGAMADVVTYSPYGVPDAGLTLTDFGFTGEYTDPSGELYLRARVYDPSMGVFMSLDPFEGVTDRPMSLNGYSWVEGNTINFTDATGKCVDNSLLPFLPAPLINYLQPEPLCIGLPPRTFDDCRNPIQSGLTTCPSMWGLYYASQCSALYQAEVASAEILFFGGSDGVNLNNIGPRPECQTPVWYDLAGAGQTYRYPGTVQPDDNGFTGKRQQAAQAQAPQSNTLVIGYSAGADSALIYAYDHRNSGNIMGVALLDGTLDGTRTDGRRLGCFPGDARPGCTDGRDTDVWQEMFNELLALGVDVYFLDDEAGGGQSKVATYVPPSNASGRFNYDARLSVPHIDDINSGRRGRGTNNSNQICQDVLGWFGQDTSQCLIETPKDCTNPF